MDKIGTDLDGVIALEPKKSDDQKMDEFYSSCVPYLRFYEKANITIITGRKITFEQTTVKWLKKNGIKYSKIFFTNIGMRKTSKIHVEHKVKAIKDEGIALFIEDTPKIAFKIKSFVPECKILLVFNEQFYSINVLDSKTALDLIDDGVKLVNNRPKTAVRNVESKPENEILLLYGDNYYTIHPVKTESLTFLQPSDTYSINF